MLRPLLLALTSVTLLACSASVQRAVTTTEAATQMQQVTRSRTNELDPAISPDAKTIVYEVADSLDATPHLEAMDVKDAVSGGPERVEYSSRSVMGLEPAWMPDGSRLVFVSNALGPHKLVETIGPSLQETRLLGYVGDPAFIAAWPAVSPDGTVAMTLGKMDLLSFGLAVPSTPRLGPRPLRSRRLRNQSSRRGDRSRLEPRWNAHRLLAHGGRARSPVRHERRRHRRDPDHRRHRRRRPPILVSRRERARLLLRAWRGGRLDASEPLLRATGWLLARSAHGGRSHRVPAGLGQGRLHLLPRQRDRPLPHLADTTGPDARLSGADQSRVQREQAPGITSTLRMRSA